MDRKTALIKENFDGRNEYDDESSDFRFSHVYCDEKIPKNDRVHWLDCSDIAECDLYCSKRAEEEIRARIEPYGIRGIHFLDSGNYHYVTGIMTEQIKQGFSLILFDHHTDMQNR